MKIHFHKVPLEPSKSFSIRHDIKPHDGTSFHYHPELELRFIVKGKGNQYIGNNVNSFSDGDMVLLGENLPHMWRSDEEYFEEKANRKSENYTLEFKQSHFSADFLKMPEARAIPVLFDRAKKGLFIKGETKEILADLLRKLTQTNGLKSMVYLLEIVQVLSETKEYQTISPGYAYNKSTGISKSQRLEKVYSFVSTNYTSEINLEEVASLANFCTSAFCRYFKTVTNQTFIEYVNEIRISNACKELIENNLSTEMICYASGFNTLSNFNRHFLKITGMTPSTYKKQYNYPQLHQ